MPIDRINFKTHTEEKRTNEILHAENVKEHLCAISEFLFQEDLKVGFGNYANVYRDAEAGADLKREKDSRPVRQSVLAMQEIKGYSFDKLIPKNPGEKPEQEFPETFNVDQFFFTLKKFIQKMHFEKNIYHRDLYARNIMIEESTGKPVVIDFGDSVDFNELYAEEGEKDAYGRLIAFDSKGNKIIREDEDLKNIDELETQIRNFLTSKEISV